VTRAADFFLALRITPWHGKCSLAGFRAAGFRVSRAAHGQAGSVKAQRSEHCIVPGSALPLFESSSRAVQAVPSRVVDLG
jgi:hypothetical protein